MGLKIMSIEESYDFACRLNEALDEMNAPERGRAQFLVKRLPFKISVNGVKKWLNGEAMPETSRISSIAETVNKNPHWLLFGYQEVGVREPKPDYGLDDYGVPSIAQVEAKTFPATVAHKTKEDSSKILGSVDAWDDDTAIKEDEVSLRFLKSVQGAAGSNGHNDEFDNGYRLRFSRRTLSRLGIIPEKAICIAVSGNSMEPQLPNGSTVGIDTASTTVSDGKIYAIRHGRMVRIKVLYNLPGGGLRIRSYNSDEYEDENYSLSQIESEDISVIGRVFWSSVLY
jgi:phage repressor protein C with HTH and peptisase S24 domain